MTLFDDGLEEPPEADAPRVFTRLITTPPAFPWDQAKAADLEARLNAPVASPDIVGQLRRLEIWRPGAPGRFVAAYVRAGEIGQGLTTDCSVDGRTVPVTFVSAERRREQLRRLSLLAGAGAAVVVALVGGVAAAIAGRMSGEERLAQAESLAQRQAALAARASDLGAQDRALRAVSGDERRIDALARDLAWASRNRNPAAAVEAFHWRPAYFAVEVRGETAPFKPAPDRQIRRAGRQVRTGVWLWGVGPRLDQDAGAAVR
ncbi:MAG TPA: hypothetical protein VEA44_15985 [Caulobacter sp.]|nr:hypothetical protein [Caulobacter sp.]